MNNTPLGNRKHIVIYGKTNSGKSSLMNKIVGQDMSIVSDKEGTTTDAVWKAMELIPVGPVVFFDTAGLYDNTELGKERQEKTKSLIKRTDVALYVVDAQNIVDDEIKEHIIEFKKYNIPYILVFNKSDKLSHSEIDKIKNDYEKSIIISTFSENGIDELKTRIAEIIKNEEDELPIIGDLLPYGSKVILVVPVDSEAPKGRLILPQVQCLRDCLDHGIKSYVVRDTELESALQDIKDVDLVITDSQAFKKVAAIVPENIKITGFSMLFARQKGDIKEFLHAAQCLNDLKPNDNVLVFEGCTHNVSHEDIGRVKIPKMLNSFVHGKLNYTYMVSHDFPDNLEDYKLVIHCGACMLNRKTVITRVKACQSNNIPIINYGVLISFVTNTLDRSRKIFNL